MDLFNELQDLMVKHRFRPRKKLGQHFVVNEALVEKLAKLANLDESDTVLEIGPGTGFLTRKLLQKSKVVAVEVDESLCDLLEEEMPGKGLNLICRDFLKAKLPKFNKVVSLPPYFHSAAIMRQLVRHDFELGILVLQKEFAEKLVALPGFDEYSALSVLAQYSFEPRILERVSPGSFFPKPKEESCILMLKARKRFGEVKDMEGFAFFMKTIFRYRNKNLKNALEKGSQFITPSLKIGKREFGKRAAGLPMLGEKVCLIPVKRFVEIFNRLA